MSEAGGAPIIPFPTAADWEAWLEENHATSDGIWLKFAKKSAKVPSVTYEEAVLAALCFGWIDGQGKGFDAEWHIQRFTPRRKRSVWSRINRDRAKALIAEGRMRPAGLAAVDAARADGRWDAAYEPPSTMAVPDDLRAALDQSPAAAEMFESLNKTNRFAILHRVTTAVRPETRRSRIEKFVAMLERGEKIH